ncbi:PDDEXK nuclease domain-containing protein [Candidatus Palauibacter sp.]|uniref:PDDEXK nuclease domain-containing protein n=1 Tax=Candidatus Palauibacter sp. TaxID=3101350 RepID=UPI003B017DC4
MAGDDTGWKTKWVFGWGGVGMSWEFDFERLVELCRRTHEETRRSASRAIDRSLVVRNWLFGWYIVEYEQNGADRAEYGKQTLKKLSAALKAVIGRGFSVDVLEQMRRFYRNYENIIEEVSVGDDVAIPARVSGHGSNSDTLSRISRDQPKSDTLSRISSGLSPATDPSLARLAARFPLGWSHYVTLLSVTDPDARRFYEIEAESNDWSVRELKRQLDSSLYERLALSRDKHEVRRLAREGQVVEKASDLIKDPVILEFLGLEESLAYSESDLETAIIDRLQQFLLELGKGFLFEARQKRFSFDDSHFFVDLVFYNRLLRCYVLIDLKLGNLTHQDLGQMQMYVNYFDRYVRTGDELPTVGILLCDDKNDAVVELTLPEDANIYASKYQLYLPSRQELADQLAIARREVGGNDGRP